MSQFLQEREKKAYDVLSGNRGQRKGGYQRSMRGPVTPVAKKEEPSEEAPRRHWAELLTVIEKCDQILKIYDIDREPFFESTVVVEQPEVVWSVPTQFKAPSPLTEGKKIDVNSMATMHNIIAPPQIIEPTPGNNGNAHAVDLPMLQLQMLAMRPKI